MDSCLRGTIGGVVAFMAYAIAPPALAFCDSTCVPWLNSTYEKEYTVQRGQNPKKDIGPIKASCDSTNDVIVGVVGWSCGTGCIGPNCVNTPEHIRLDGGMAILACDPGDPNDDTASGGFIWIRCRRP
jgi:hypothetical protein